MWIFEERIWENVSFSSSFFSVSLDFNLFPLLSYFPESYSIKIYITWLRYDDENFLSLLFIKFLLDKKAYSPYCRLHTSWRISWWCCQAAGVFHRPAPSTRNQIRQSLRKGWWAGSCRIRHFFLFETRDKDPVFAKKKTRIRGSVPQTKVYF